MIRVQGGKKDQREFMSKDWPLLLKRMGMLREDKPLADFLATDFPGPEYALLRDSACRMAEGYDLADMHTVSTLSLYREWAAEGEEEEFRPEGGYRRLIDWLAEVCRQQGCRLRLDTQVVTVRWKRGQVAVEVSGGEVFSAEQLVVTVSLGVLKAGSIGFSPDIPLQREAIGRLGYGSVVKVLLEFDAPFWGERKKAGQTLFILSDQECPTWWTQAADENTLITGWISGERMRAFQRLEKEARIDSCLRSLAAIFLVGVEVLRQALRASLVMDWETAPSVHGGYSFDTVGASDARAVLSKPVEETLYFAGEGLYEGDVPGTVEAAFCSGVTIADKIIAQS